MSQASQLFGPPPILHDPEPDAEISASNGGFSMLQSTAIVALAYVLSRILGLFREMILARKFGTTPEMDAYVAAFRIPDMLFLVVMSGAFGAAFIPVFGGFIDDGDRRRASRLASSLLTWTGISILVLSMIAFILAGPLTSIVAPGFDTHTHTLTVDLMRPLLLSPVFLGLAIACKGILEAQNQFAIPAFAPVLYNIAIIVAALFFADRFGIQAVVWGVILGALLQLILQAPAVFRSGLTLRPLTDRAVDGLKDVLKLLGPRVIGQAAFQINFIVVSALASILGAQYVSGLNYAWLLLMLPHGVLAISTSTVVFPSLVTLFHRGDHRGFTQLLDQVMRPLLFLSIPASAGLILLGKPIISVIFEGGRFTSESTDIVAGAFRWFAFGLVGYVLTEMLARVFYSMKDTRTPVVTGILTIILNIILCRLLMDSLGVEGLAIALSITTAAEAIIMMFFLRDRNGQVFSSGFFIWLMKVIAATVAMMIVIGLSRPLLNNGLDMETGFIGHAIILGVSLGIYLMVFIAAAHRLRIPELAPVINRITDRLPSQRSTDIPSDPA